MPAPTAAQVYRDFEVDGVPSSGKHNVKKSEARAWGTWVEGIISAFTSNGGLIFSSKALLDADLAHAANSMAWVVGDPTATNNGVYMKVGASGSGSWTRVADLPYPFIPAEDVGEGEPNAIQATSALPISGSALVMLNVFEANTASPVTVSFNGETPLTIKTNSGNDIAPGGLASGMNVLGRVSGSTFRILNDQVSSAIVAQAEAAAAAAQQAAIDAEGVGFPVAIWDSGTTRTMIERARDTYSILDAPGNADRTGNNESTSSFEAMLAEGVKCEIVSGDFVLTRKLVIPDGVTLEGQGRGYEFSHRTKLLFAGTGTKEHEIAGATTTNVANPDAGAPYLADSGTRGDTYSTLDLTSDFSAAIILGKASGLKRLGIYPNFNGVTGYAGTTGGLSDEWDVGVWARNSDWWQVEDCNVIGHWRKAGLLVSANDIGDGKVPSNEIGQAIRSQFQGFRGISIRSPEIVTGSNWGFAGTDFMNCLVRGLWHQSGHLATSSILDVPFEGPSGALEISGDTMRGVQFLNSTFIGRDDMLAFFGKCSEIQFDGCYEESKNIRVNGASLPNSLGSRMVATTDAVDVVFLGNSQYGIDFSPNQARDGSLTGQRYPGAAGVFTPQYSTDDDYTIRRFGSYIGYRFRKSNDRYIFSDQNDASQIVLDAFGRIQSKLLFSGTITLADDAAGSIPTPKNGGMCAITYCGGTEDSDFPSVSQSGIVTYDTGSGPSCVKVGGGANFIAVTTNVTGTTGTDGNITVGVVAGSLRVENRSSASAVFRYAFFA